MTAALASLRASREMESSLADLAAADAAAEIASLSARLEAATAAARAHAAEAAEARAEAAVARAAPCAVCSAPRPTAHLVQSLQQQVQAQQTRNRALRQTQQQIHRSARQQQPAPEARNHSAEQNNSQQRKGQCAAGVQREVGVEHQSHLGAGAIPRRTSVVWESVAPRARGEGVFPRRPSAPAGIVQQKQPVSQLNPRRTGHAKLSASGADEAAQNVAPLHVQTQAKVQPLAPAPAQLPQHSQYQHLSEVEGGMLVRSGSAKSASSSSGRGWGSRAV